MFGTKANETIIRGSIHTGISANGNTITPQPAAYNSTQLSSGITVLTESVTVPSNIHLGIFVDVGTRDETA